MAGPLPATIRRRIRHVVGQAATGVPQHQDRGDHADRRVQHQHDAQADRHLGRVPGPGQPVLGQHQALHDPGLTAALGQQPAGGGHQERGQHGPGGHPEEEPGGVEFLPPEQEHPPQADQEHHGGDVGHHPHRPVLDEDVRHVVAGAVLLVVLGVDLRQALHLAVPGAGGQDGQQVRDLDDLGRGFVLVVAADLDHRERARLAGVPVGLGGGDLHRLVVGLVDAEPAADRELQHGRDGEHEQAKLRAAAEQLHVLAAAHVPGRHGEQHGAAEDQRHRQHVRVAPQEDRVGEHVRDGGQLGPTGVRVDGVAARDSASRSWPR